MSTQSPTQFEMPDLLDVPLMVRQYDDLSEAERAKLNAALVDPFGEVISRGRRLVALMTGLQSKTRAADTGIDRGWGGLDGGVEAFERLYADSPTPLTAAERAQRERASTVRTRWIGGLGFLRLPYLEQWTESEQRLAAAHEPMVEGGESAAQALGALGLSWALERLQALHDTYGRALGVHGPLNPATEEVRGWEEALDEFLAGLRFFHARTPDVWAALSKPYTDALARGKERRRRAAQRPKAAAPSAEEGAASGQPPQG